MAVPRLQLVRGLLGRMKIDDRVLPVVALILGTYVVLAEIPFWTSRSSLAPALTALGLGLIAVAAAQLMRTRR